MRAADFGCHVDDLPRVWHGVILPRLPVAVSWLRARKPLWHAAARFSDLKQHVGLSLRKRRENKMWWVYGSGGHRTLDLAINSRTLCH